MSDIVLFHYLHFINCLPPADAGGAKRIFDSVKSIDGSLGPLVATYEEAETPEKFLFSLKQIENKIVPNSIPLIHFDAHADRNLGLYFGENSYLSWDAVVESLAGVNAKISNRLFIVFCACSAFYINSKLHPNSKAPFSFCISPIAEITLAELEDIVPKFYQALVGENNLDDAITITQDHLHPVSSDIFLKDIMVRMIMTTMGKKGQTRREYLLTEIIKNSDGPISKKHARKFIKDRLKLSQRDVKAFTEKYLCGREAPFTASDILKEAKERIGS